VSRYAIFLKDELDNAPFLRVIAESSNLGSFSPPPPYNSLGSYPSIRKSSFNITVITPITLTSMQTGEAVPAFICFYK
jgi:hypothetical protein